MNINTALAENDVVTITGLTFASTATNANIDLTGTLDADSVQASTFGTSSQNAYGARTVSTGNPSGGNNGDIWYKY